MRLLRVFLLLSLHGPGAGIWHISGQQRKRAAGWSMCLLVQLLGVEVGQEAYGLASVADELHIVITDLYLLRYLIWEGHIGTQLWLSLPACIMSGRARRGATVHTPNLLWLL